MFCTLLALIFSGNFSWAALLFPLIWICHILAIVGLAWMLSLANLALRDIGNIINLSMVVIMVLTPIAYTREMVPESLRVLLLVNPLAYFVLAYQDVLVMGRLPDVWTIAFILIFSAGLFLLGCSLFYRMKQVMLEYI
jgi:lipopolysaccharide transport system permease protein